MIQDDLEHKIANLKKKVIEMIGQDTFNQIYELYSKLEADDQLHDNHVNMLDSFISERVDKNLYADVRYITI